jgi:limonene-1,2-epoxide hydrolase
VTLATIILNMLSLYYCANVRCIASILSFLLKLSRTAASGQRVVNELADKVRGRVVFDFDVYTSKVKLP